MNEKIKRGHFQTMEHYAATKRNEALTWTKLENIALRERSQAQRLRNYDSIRMTYSAQATPEREGVDQQLLRLGDWRKGQWWLMGPGLVWSVKF